MSTQQPEARQIARYYFRNEGMSDPPTQEESTDGQFVEYSDHSEVVQGLHARIAELEALVKREPLTEEQALSAIQSRPKLFGRIKLTYESGAYSIDRPTIVAMDFVRAVEQAHGIKGATDDN